MEEIWKYLKENYEDGACIGTWDGGNDSGWVEIETDEHTNEIQRICYESLDYGGWAWDFHSSGNIMVDYEGSGLLLDGNHVDYDERVLDSYVYFTLELPDPLPQGIKSLSFGTNPWENQMDVRFDLQDGPITPEMNSFRERITKEIRKFYEDELSELHEQDLHAEVAIFDVTKTETHKIEVTKPRDTKVNKFITFNI